MTSTTLTKQAQKHLDRARENIAKGEDFYRTAAKEIAAAMKADPDLTHAAVGEQVGKHQTWVTKLLRWSEADDHQDGAPFGGKGQDIAQTKSRTRKAAREHPEIIAEAITEAPPAAQRKIADSIAAAPTAEPSLTGAVKPERKPRPQKNPEDKLGEAVFALWEVGEILMDHVPDGESRVRMTALAEKAERLSVGIVQLLGTGQLEDEFRQAVEEVGADL